MTDFTPKVPGYYWARWIECEPGTEDHDEFEARDFWSPVEVTMNTKNPQHPDHLRVFVLGFAGSQHLSFFEWGNRIRTPLLLRKNSRFGY